MDFISVRDFRDLGDALVGGPKCGSCIFLLCLSLRELKVDQSGDPYQITEWFMGVAPGGRDDHWVVAVRLDNATARNCVGDVSCRPKCGSCIFSCVSLTQRVEGGPEW